MLDEPFLTDIRTAVAGAVAAKFLAPSSVSCIGIFGTGVQARLQLQHLMPVTDCRDVIEQSDVAELGDLISGAVPGRTSDDQVTVADLTGVAVQDIQIATAVFHSVMNAS